MLLSKSQAHLLRISSENRGQISAQRLQSKFCPFALCRFHSFHSFSFISPPTTAHFTLSVSHSEQLTRVGDCLCHSLSHLMVSI